MSESVAAVFRRGNCHKGRLDSAKGVRTAQGVPGPRRQAMRDEWTAAKDLRSYTYDSQKRSNPLTRIFVGNLSYDTSANELRSAFERHGRVADVQVITDRMSGRPRGFAFVAMPRLDDADEAIARLNGSVLGGRRLVVNAAKESSRSAYDPGEKPRMNLLDLIERKCDEEAGRLAQVDLR